MEKTEKNYLSVKEFANIARVRTQRIYQILDKDLQKFCKLFGKSKKINIEALQIFGKSLQEQQLALTKSLANSQALHAGTIKEHIDSSTTNDQTKTKKWRNLLSWIFNKNQ